MRGAGGKNVKGLVSVIIPTYNRKDELCACLNSVLAQEYRQIEIIVVDDLSEDDTVRHLSAYYSQITVLTSPFRSGPAYLRNKGINASNGEFLLFLDSDVILNNHQMISKMVNTVSGDRRIGQLGGETPVYLGIEEDGYGKNINFWGENYPVVSSIRSATGSTMKSCSYLATCNCFVRKQTALKVGGFDPYYIFGGEDVDFGYIIQREGFTNYVNYEMTAKHMHALKGRYADETFRYHFTRIMFNLKHFTIFRNVIIFIRDFGCFILFYLALVPKLAIKIIKKEKIVHENIFGRYYVMKSYFLNLKNYFKIKKRAGRCFLSQKEMALFSYHLMSTKKL